MMRADTVINQQARYDVGAALRSGNATAAEGAGTGPNRCSILDSS
jgi:hypothetical protein